MYSLMFAALTWFTLSSAISIIMLCLTIKATSGTIFLIFFVLAVTIICIISYIRNKHDYYWWYKIIIIIFVIMIITSLIVLLLSKYKMADKFSLSIANYTGFGDNGLRLENCNKSYPCQIKCNYHINNKIILRAPKCVNYCTLEPIVCCEKNNIIFHDKPCIHIMQICTATIKNRKISRVLNRGEMCLMYYNYWKVYWGELKYMYQWPYILFVIISISGLISSLPLIRKN